MKVLFAVNNDKISEAVIKKYPKEYKELLSYKNVYYFNAILKEIQNDKSYDRIVISEDLEPFVNTNHDSIDNFIFNHLDKISDEAQGNDGREMSIILICSERRTFGSNILNKLFSIGIYNALIGNDRSMDNLCRLINKPRNKKEAKIYYRIDQATYESAVDNGEVSETEIQNILNHFKKLGKSTDRYTDSFNNIAAQYTDDQLRLIVNVLPIKVKAVLEAESDKYQSLMGTSGENKERTVAPVEPGIRVNTIGSGRENNVNGPIVIPSSVKRFTSGSGPIIPTNTATRQQQAAAPVREPVKEQPKQQVNQASQLGQRPAVQANQVAQVQKNPAVQAAQANPVQRQPEAQAKTNVIPQPVATTPKVAPVIEEPDIDETDDLTDTLLEDIQVPETPVVEDIPEKPINEDLKSNGQRYTGTIAQVKKTLIARRKVVPTASVPPVAPAQPQVSATIPNIEDIEPEVETVVAEEPKRGRGRPRKIVTEQEVKPKGKRGRPRKNAPEENNLEDLLGGLGASSTDDVMMPGLEEDVLPGLEETPSVEEMLPGLDDTIVDDVLPGVNDDASDDNLLPGLDDDTTDDNSLPGLDDDASDDNLLPGLDNDAADDNLLPGLDDDTTDDNLLPGLDDDAGDDDLLPGLDGNESDEIDPNDEGDEIDVNSLLAGLDDDDNSESLPGLENDATDDDLLPGLDDGEDDGLLPGLDNDAGDDGLLPGLDDDAGDDSLLPGLDDDAGDDGLLPGLDDAEDDGLLPGLDSDTTDDGLLSGLDDDTPQEESVLPGMGFEDDDNDVFNSDNDSNTAIESIKPQIDYSMSNLNSLLSKDKKIVAFLGATKNGTSFIINNLALMFSMMGINTAILDMTQNKNSYYLFTDSREELRKIAYTSLSKLENGYADGIKFNKNLTVYTALPSDGAVFENAEPILSTLVQNHSLVLIDTDFTTPPAYFASSQEIYLVQSMDILTIQPLTAFLRELKFKGAWEPEKARVVINKEVPIRILSKKTIVGGMSRYNGPDMSVMTDLFNKDMVSVCSIPFDEKVYAKYLETLATCKLSISSLPKQFRSKLELLANMVYPRLNDKTSYSPSPDMGGAAYNPQGNTFSKDTNNILNKMKKKF